jgi:hypothetical protein
MPSNISSASSLIHWTRNVGLANRLRALAGYYVLANTLNLDLYICWEADPACQAQFEELFDLEASGLNQEQLVDPREKDRMADKETVVVKDEIDWYDKIWEQHQNEVGAWSTFREGAVQFLRSLRPVSAIRDRIESFTERHPLCEVPGIHIRWTDNLGVYDHFEENAANFERNDVSKLGGFVKFIEDYEDSDRLFFATDNRRVHDAMHLLFEDRLIEPDRNYIPNRSIPRRMVMKLVSLTGLRIGNRRSTSLDEAVVDMWLLSRCRFIVGTYYSSFSEVSAIIGGIDYYDVRRFDLTQNRLVDWLRGKRNTSPRNGETPKKCEENGGGVLR